MSLFTAGMGLAPSEMRAFVANAPSAAEANARFWTSHLADLYHDRPEFDEALYTKLGESIVHLVETVQGITPDPIGFEYDWKKGPVGTLLSQTHKAGFPTDYDWNTRHASWTRTRVEPYRVIVSDLTPLLDTFVDDTREGKPTVILPEQDLNRLALRHQIWPEA